MVAVYVVWLSLKMKKRQKSHIPKLHVQIIRLKPEPRTLHSDYPNRQQQVPDCIQLTPERLQTITWLPLVVLIVV